MTTPVSRHHPRAPEPDRPDHSAFSAEFARPLRLADPDPPARPDATPTGPLDFGVLRVRQHGVAGELDLDVQLAMDGDPWTLRLGPFDLDDRATARLIHLARILDVLRRRARGPLPESGRGIAGYFHPWEGESRP